MALRYADTGLQNDADVQQSAVFAWAPGQKPPRGLLRQEWEAFVQWRGAGGAAATDQAGTSTPRTVGGKQTRSTASPTLAAGRSAGKLVKRPKAGLPPAPPLPGNSEAPAKVTNSGQSAQVQLYGLNQRWRTTEVKDRHEELKHLWKDALNEPTFISELEALICEHPTQLSSGSSINAKQGEGWRRCLSAHLAEQAPAWL